MVLSTRRERLGGEDGFTLIELLVVILIIGILAAIAIPSFLNQKTKAVDASAKELAHSAQTAAETYATDNGGSYTGLTLAVLNQYETTIQTAAGQGNAFVLSVTPNGGPPALGYTLVVDPANGPEEFTLTRNANGSTTRTCTVNAVAGATGGGCVAGTW